MSVALAVDPALQMALRAALSALLLAAVWHKLRDFSRFRSALADYRVLPDRLVAPAGVGLVAAETCAGLGLLARGAAPGAAWLAAALLSLYAAAIGLNLLRGRRDIDCGCAGPGARRPLSEALVVRNLALALAAVACAAPSVARPFVWVDAVTAAAAAAACLLLYAALDGLLANAPRLRAEGGGGSE